MLDDRYEIFGVDFIDIGTYTYINNSVYLDELVYSIEDYAEAYGATPTREDFIFWFTAEVDSLYSTETEDEFEENAFHIYAEFLEKFKDVVEKYYYTIVNMYNTRKELMYAS